MEILSLHAMLQWGIQMNMLGQGEHPYALLYPHSLAPRSGMQALSRLKALECSLAQRISIFIAFPTINREEVGSQSAP